MTRYFAWKRAFSQGASGRTGLAGFTGFAGLAILALLPISGSATTCPTCGPVVPSGLEVHEWGTFTTLNSSKGRPLTGLYVDATRLPAFVHGLPYFNFDPVKGWAKPDRLKNVTVKMETPVIYFHSKKEMDVDVKVRFQGGTISQWYPACYDCEANPVAPSVDFAKAPYQGHIGWKAKVLAPGYALPYTTTALGGETGEWIAPRHTEANQIRGQKGEIEKFLFYRGLGHFESAVYLDFLPDGTLRVKNRGAEDIGYLMVYERAHDIFKSIEMPDGSIVSSYNEATVWYQGPVKAGEELKVKREKRLPDYAHGSKAMDDFHAAMVKAGLTSMEARALLNTWYNGYFIEGGLKAFWIQPRAQVDRILPLEITPAPDKLERVIVGRSEILTPEFEAVIRQSDNVDSLEIRFGKDKYYLAYLDLLENGSGHVATALIPRANTVRGQKAAFTRPGKDWATPWLDLGNSNSGAAGQSSAGEPRAIDIQGRALRPLHPIKR